MPESELSLFDDLFTAPGGCILHLARFSLDGVLLRDDRLPPRGILRSGGLASLLSSFLDDLILVFSFLAIPVSFLLLAAGLESSCFDLGVVPYHLVLVKPGISGLVDLRAFHKL